MTTNPMPFAVTFTLACTFAAWMPSAQAAGAALDTPFALKRPWQQ
ncbi:hypothetical protein F4827_000091 [Paraburkholderia bannensis]|uniref:Uncharacterized protein n=1 Tax=Paraburkholderia bannensis TaxID=765414 RepID=A0A7W9WQL5_9BURK|nr:MULTISPECIES: hypothetical protein [Paraburkholderia]MBB3255702.1 hypothetical protein [Paraburkholderia sp. WP4_3_2]MBB6100287.1 hypothetical protein [Paraburkholderia bannensis]